MECIGLVYSTISFCNVLFLKYSSDDYQGVSAYSGGLWLAALSATVSMAQLLELKGVEAKYSDMLRSATTVYEQVALTHCCLGIPSLTLDRSYCIEAVE